MIIKKKIVFSSFKAILILFCFALSAFAGTEDYEGKLITAIETRGNRSISSIAILSKMKSRVGAIYSENIVNDDIKRLYLLGYFNDIDVKTEEFREGVKIIAIVSERAVIENVLFVGFGRLRLRREKLEALIESKPGHYLDYSVLNDDRMGLEKTYIQKGFPEANVEYEVELDEETNKALVKFISKESRRIKIRRIYVEGNENFPDKKVLKIIKTKRAWLLGSGILKEDVLQEDMERIKSFYLENGFTDVDVDYGIEEDPVKPFLYITITIQEGKQYFVGEVYFKGNTVLEQDKLLGSLENCFSGMVYNPDGLTQDKFIVQGIYFDLGYIMAEANATSVLNPSTGKIDVTYQITESEVAYINKIKVRGNIKTKDVVVRREMRLLPGDRFDGPKLRRSKERLTNLGFFEEVSYDTESTDILNQRDLIVEVKEAKTGTFSFGGGYSTIDDFIGFIEIEQRNFDWRNFPYFTGDGQNLKLRAEAGTVSNNFNLSFTEPWLFDYPLSFGFDVYRMSHSRESDIGWGYDQTRKGGDIRLGKEISEYITASAIYRYDEIEISDVISTASSVLQDEEGSNTISSVGLGLAYDTRDNVFRPTTGVVVSGNVDVAGGPFGGDKNFIRTSTRTSKFFPLFKDSVIELNLRLGLIDGYSDTGEVPVYERFFCGGAYSVRGYEERMVGPIDELSKDPVGGEFLAVFNLEYTYPLLDVLRLAAFYDTGNVWQKASGFGGGDLKSSVGLGVRIKTPVGPIRLDYGIPLDIQAGEVDKKSGRVHFSMGQGF